MYKAELDRVASKIMELSRTEGFPIFSMDSITAHDFFVDVRNYNNTCNLERQSCIDLSGIVIAIDESLGVGEFRMTSQLNKKEQGMTRHKHADMIIAKAENVELVRITKLDDNQGCEWVAQSDIVQRSTKFNEQSDYFLCLPQHREACLHWLNGGEVQYRHGVSHDWGDCDPAKVWARGSIFMQGNVEIKAKTHKERRWIAVHNADNTVVLNTNFKSINEAKDATHGGNWQFIEIEVEV